ncbi:MAG: HEPN domain-containing protein [Candidatus Competibacteraceae bacterium]|nr:MAG: HEPN domain-containing protein [Candidatus Competibacteraceae bacterium]
MAETIGRLVGAWLSKARHDIETARRMVDHAEPITDTAVYPCQQAAEKALKAVLIKRGEAVFKTHDLVALLTKLLVKPTVERRLVKRRATMPWGRHENRRLVLSLACPTAVGREIGGRIPDEKQDPQEDQENREPARLEVWGERVLEAATREAVFGEG